MSLPASIRRRFTLGAGILLILFAGAATVKAPHLRGESVHPANPTSASARVSTDLGAHLSDAPVLPTATVGSGVQVEASARPDNPANGTWQVLARFGSFGATLAVFGVVGLMLFAVPREEPQGSDLAASLRKLGLLVVTVQVVGVFARLFAQTALLRSVFGEMSVKDVAVSSWGTLLLLQTVGGVIVGIAFLFGGRLRRNLAGLGALVLALAFPWVGHAASGGAIEKAVDSVHVASAGVWIGGLGLMLALLVPVRGWARSHERVAVLLPRFARTAMIAGPLTVLTGALNAWFHAPALSRWLSEPYGQLLSAKIVLVGLVLALGALHHFRLEPLAGTDEASPRLLRTGTMELLLASTVVLVTAFLVATAMD